MGFVILALAMLVMAGCGEPTARQASRPELELVDGDAALAFVKAFATYENGAPRYRIPGSPGQAEGAQFLWNATAVSGWERSWQNFTGADYAKLDRSAVAHYAEVGGSCTQADHDRIATLPFHNLLVVRHAAREGAPLVLLGAHWDSQMHSDYDPDPSKRDLPDPGANDGASGVGLLLQMMRELDAQLPDLPFSVGLFFIDGEDGFFDCYPLAGSLYFAQHQPLAVDSFILLDMVGDPGAKFPKEGYSRNSAPELQDLIWGHGQALDGGEHFLNRTVTIQDDHVALANAGIPSVDIIDAGRPTTFPPQWDTTQDTVEKVDAAMLALVGDVLLHVLEDDALLNILDNHAAAA
jgi:hypothetical protein